MKLVTCVSFFVCLHSCLFAGQDSISFDSLFPKRGLEEVFDVCMQVQHEFDVCSRQDSLHADDLSLFLDMVVGKLFHAVFCLKKLVQDKIFFHQEDVEYILNSVSMIKQGYKKLHRHTMPKQSIHVDSLLQDLESGLLKLKETVKTEQKA